MKNILILISLSLLANISIADDNYKFINSNTFVKNPLDLRDPFRRKINKRRTNIGSKNHTIGVYKNYDDNVDNKPIDTLKIVGVVTGAERRAMARMSGSKDTFILKEGMRVGPNQAEVKAILPGGVILLEKIRNVYDQDEYLETVLPVSGE